MSALSHLTVLDLTRARSGPSAARQFADWGANVIMIELPGTAEVDAFGTSRDAGDFQNLHRGKRSMTLNLKDERGVALLKRMAKSADVLIENFRPDVKARLGIDYPDIQKVNPRIVYASISGFGQDGPYARRPGFDQIVQGMSGLMSVTGYAGEGPRRAGLALADVGSGIYCAFGILAALLERERSGEGQWVTTSLLEALIAMMDFQAARWLVDGVVPRQVGNDHPTMAPMGVFPAGDGDINIAAVGAVMWTRLCAALGRPELETDPRFSTDALRVENRDALRDILSQELKKHPGAYWIEKLNAAGVPSGPIYSMDSVFSDEQVRHLGLARQVQHHRLGSIEVVGQPVHLSRTDSEIFLATPEQGRHTREILQETGLSPAEIDDFVKEGIV